ncbi:hypothetical protein [Blastomonas fulva]|uniref:hypothetical protein n=1 Tax=Blastomonas fulva TaxID=1550728 RepID=UPI003F6FF8B4
MLARIYSQRHLVISVGARSALGLAISVSTVASHKAEASVELFQLLMLQTVFSILISGAGFIKGITAGNARNFRSILTAYAGYAALLAVIAAILVHAVLPSSLTGTLTSAVWKIDLLLVGAVGASLTPLVQGFLVADGRPGQAYGPASVLSLVATALLLGLSGLSADLIVVIWCLSQIVIFVVTACLVAGAMTPDMADDGAPESFASLIGGTASIGVINGLNIFIVFSFREFWSEHSNAAIAASVFFALRVSDVVLQIMFNAIATQQLSVRAIVESRMTRLALGIMAALFLTLCTALAFAHDQTGYLAMGWIGLCIAIIIQSIVDILRIGSSYATIVILRTEPPHVYGLVAIVPTLAAALLAWSTFPLAREAVIYLFQISAAMVQIGLCYGYLRHKLGRQADPADGIRRS